MPLRVSSSLIRVICQRRDGTTESRYVTDKYFVLARGAVCWCRHVLLISLDRPSIGPLHYCVNEDCYSVAPPASTLRRKSVTATICGHKTARGVARRRIFLFQAVSSLARSGVSTRQSPATRTRHTPSLSLSRDRHN